MRYKLKQRKVIHEFKADDRSLSVFNMYDINGRVIEEHFIGDIFNNTNSFIYNGERLIHIKYKLIGGYIFRSPIYEGDNIVSLQPDIDTYTSIRLCYDQNNEISQTRHGGVIYSHGGIEIGSKSGEYIDLKYLGYYKINKNIDYFNK